MISTGSSCTVTRSAARHERGRLRPSRRRRARRSCRRRPGRRRPAGRAPGVPGRPAVAVVEARGRLGDLLLDRSRSASARASTASASRRVQGERQLAGEPLGPSRGSPSAVGQPRPRSQSRCSSSASTRRVPGRLDLAAQRRLLAERALELGGQQRAGAGELADRRLHVHPRHRPERVPRGREALRHRAPAGRRRTAAGRRAGRSRGPAAGRWRCPGWRPAGPRWCSRSSSSVEASRSSSWLRRIAASTRSGDVQGVGVDRVEVGQPAGRPGELLAGAGRAEVGQPVVEPVVAQDGRPLRVALEQLVEHGPGERRGSRRSPAVVWSVIRATLAGRLAAGSPPRRRAPARRSAGGGAQLGLGVQPGGAASTTERRISRVARGRRRRPGSTSTPFFSARSHQLGGQRQRGQRQRHPVDRGGPALLGRLQPFPARLDVGGRLGGGRAEHVRVPAYQLVDDVAGHVVDRPRLVRVLARRSGRGRPPAAAGRRAPRAGAAGRRSRSPRASRRSPRPGRSPATRGSARRPTGSRRASAAGPSRPPGRAAGRPAGRRSPAAPPARRRPRRACSASPRARPSSWSPSAPTSQTTSRSLGQTQQPVRRVACPRRRSGAHLDALGQQVGLERVALGGDDQRPGAQHVPGLRAEQPRCDPRARSGAGPAGGRSRRRSRQPLSSAADLDSPPLSSATTPRRRFHVP